MNETESKHERLSERLGKSRSGVSPPISGRMSQPSTRIQLQLYSSIFVLLFLVAYPDQTFAQKKARKSPGLSLSSQGSCDPNSEFVKQTSAECGSCDKAKQICITVPYTATAEHLKRDWTNAFLAAARKKRPAQGKGCLEAVRAIADKTVGQDLQYLSTLLNHPARKAEDRFIILPYPRASFDADASMNAACGSSCDGAIEAARKNVEELMGGSGGKFQLRPQDVTANVNAFRENYAVAPGCAREFNQAIRAEFAKYSQKESRDAIADLQQTLETLPNGPTVDCPVEQPVPMADRCRQEVPIGPATLPSKVFEELVPHGHCAVPNLLAVRAYMKEQGMSEESVEAFTQPACVRAYQRNLGWRSATAATVDPRTNCGVDPAPVELQASFWDQLPKSSLGMNPQRCVAAREMVAREKRYRQELSKEAAEASWYDVSARYNQWKGARLATVSAAKSVSVTLGDQTGRPFQSDAGGNVKTAIGEVDLDWFMDLHYGGGNCQVTEGIYGLAKTVWAARNSVTRGNTNPVPKSDPGEKRAVEHMCAGGSFEQLVPEDFMRRNCPAHYFSDKNNFDFSSHDAGSFWGSIDDTRKSNWVTPVTVPGQDPFENIY